MNIQKIRKVIQISFFLLLIYGGYAGLRFKNFLPVWSCPNSEKYSQGCFLLPLQRSQYGLETGVQDSRGITLSGYFTIRKWQGYFYLFLGFVLVAIILNRAWCGWVCPFGTLQDGFTFIREKFKIREIHFSRKTKNRLKRLKYLSAISLIIIPFLVPFGFDSGPEPLFCQFCPVKSIMSVFVGDFLNLSVHSTNEMKLLQNLIFFVIPSVVTIIFAGISITGIFLKRRFFCFLCPVGALLGVFRKLRFLRIKKGVDFCNDCGNCQRICPMGIKKVDLEKAKEDESADNCILCLECIGACSVIEKA